MLEELKNEAIQLFKDTFSAQPTALGIAPGRVELLGNHTDYNGGFVLSTALDRYIIIAAAKAPDVEGLEVVSAIHPEVQRLGRWEKNEPRPWTNYVVGVLKELDEAGVNLGGMRMAVASSVPGGSGLSSSAALEVATAKAALALFPHKIADMDLAQLCQRAENRFVGMNCGLLDQFSSVFGRENCALFLDCLSLNNRTVPFGAEDIAIIIANSMAKHALVDGEYNKLRAACMGAATALGEALGRQVSLLRDITLEEFEAHQNVLTPSECCRARHVLTENQRVLEGVEALENGDLDGFGEKLFASHASSRDDLGNSVEALDVLVDLAKDGPGIIGARLTGGGFGGCTVNLVHNAHADAFIAHLAEGFEKRMGKATDIKRLGIGGGARSEGLG